MEEGKRQGYLASSRQYGNALLGVRHQEDKKYRITAFGVASPGKNVRHYCKPAETLMNGSRLI